ncbi:hypothetical protein EXQ41_10010 [Clostridium botulinum]|nr:DUF6144 family protein [Clostridium botulinum]MBO0556328.1 hypothetical protein [Clostridium botulinum]MBO0562953.1 hypothetical protein [Clostridium botulinum]
MFDIREIQEQVIYEAVKMRAMKILESKFYKTTTKKIRMKCQCGYGMDKKLELVKELIELSSSLEELGNLQKAKDAGLFYENGDLYLQFNFCPCPMLADVDRLDSDVWCQCTTGYSKVLFEKAFQCKVNVELLRSIKMGNERCLMKIIQQGVIWK